MIECNSFQASSGFCVPGTGRGTGNKEIKDKALSSNVHTLFQEDRSVEDN